MGVSTFFMFFGGTNFAFMNGGNIVGYSGVETKPGYIPDVTSYDYDAPITEYGHYTAKYDTTQELIAAYDPLYSLIQRPTRPEIPSLTTYPDVTFSQYLPYWDLVKAVPGSAREVRVKPTPMEQLNINNGNGQSYGYIIYRKEVQISFGDVLTIRGHPRDLVQVLVNGVQVNPIIATPGDLGTKFGSWALRDSELIMNHLEDCETLCTLDLMVENMGRANFGSPHNYQQLKGIWEGDILLDGQVLDNWEHIALEMKPEWLEGLEGWKGYNLEDNLYPGPRMLRGNLDLGYRETAVDTFFDYDCSEGCQQWIHGAVFINGFNIGRYNQAGPQKSLYIPGPIIKPNHDNEVLVFENYIGSDTMKFTDQPNYGKPISNKQDRSFL